MLGKNNGKNICQFLKQLIYCIMVDIGIQIWVYINRRILVFLELQICTNLIIIWDRGGGLQNPHTVFLNHFAGSLL